ncbi:MAG: sulfatase-like hydrolase/transferase [Pirellulaceae bacterium]|nr:sulfatase-like hydrolase/transferase [Pirellulaceae bacterium]
MLFRSSVNVRPSRIVLWVMVVATAAVGVSAAVARQAGEAGLARPNVVLIVTDNHGAWTLGCYGNPDIKTPNLDRMAAEGVRFARAFSNNPVCSPTRATLLSGLMPSQHGVHNYLNAQYNTLDEFDTLPEILSRAGYTCGIVGKWHLGQFDRPGQENFTHWVVKQGGHTPSFYNTLVMDDTGKMERIEPHITPFWTGHAVNFIEKNKDRPFFLYLAYNGPYGLHTCIRGEPKNRHAATYAGNEMKSYPREPMHPWLRTNREHVGNVSSMRNYASQVSLVDDGVGELLATLDKAGLDQNTLVIFTADQGMAGGHGGFWGMGDHTRPRTIYDWTLHIPLIVRQPGKVVAGKTVDHLVANYDILPSLLSHVGLADQIPDKPRGPGRDFSPLLRGEQVEWEDVLFGEYGKSIRMVRTDRWKYIERADEGPWQLFNLAADPGEKTNLHGNPEHAAIQATLQQRLHEFFASYSDPLWDMWKPGGTSKHLHTKERPR